MAVDDIHQRSKKRKQVDDEPESHIPQHAVQLEMLTDEEDSAEISSDDGEADEFPEIDAASDSEEGEGTDTEDKDEEDESESEDGGDGEEDEDEESDDDSDGPDSDASLHVFPKAKMVTSDITGKPKRVYPEIEPDYDSDSSTEDVRFSRSNDLKPY